jgi:competence protein ComEC
MALRCCCGTALVTICDLFAEAAGHDGEPADLGAGPYSSCSKDACVASLRKDAAEWRLLAIRSSTRIEWAALTKACAEADIVVADRRLPRGCTPRWLKLDRAGLEQTGGVAIFLGTRPKLETVAERQGDHPWAQTKRPISARSTPPARSRPDR